MKRAEHRSRGLAIPGDYETIAHSRKGVAKLSSSLRRDSVSVIAEIKRNSPSQGAISPTLDSADQARRYESGGAAAISVLTEPDSFGGSDLDIEQVMAASSLPVLKKDFHVTAIQLAHAARLGVSAALVIARAVSPDQLRTLAAAARELDLEILLEIRDEWELERALESNACLIGVNNRTLETLEVDPTTASRLIPLIPPGCVAIAESGYTSRESVEEAATAGADAVLVGSSLSGSPDPEAALRSIVSVPRSRPRREAK